MNPLRPYQETAVTDALAALAEHGSAILQMPTGSGKTRTAVEIIKRTDGVVWFFCHRVEIAQQAAKAFKAAGVDFGVVSPRAIDPATGKKYPFEPQKRVQIISVGALARRIADLPHPSLVIWDECHHTPAPTWAAIRAGLGDARHLGLTATPERLDGKGLAEWFGALVVGPPIEALIQDGWLSPYRYFAPSDPDLSAAKMQAGDYAKKDLAKIMNTPVLIGDAIAEYRRVADGKRAIAFCASVDASKALVDRFNGAGIPALHVDGTTSAAERGGAVRALETGAIKVLSNVEVFTEGFDVPGIEAAILMRPTKSPTLLLQMIGRALRPAPGKVAVVMDHAGLWQDHGAFDGDWQWSLDGGAAKARRRAALRGPRCCPECKEVRAERVIVCDGCGFEFPSGREIGEYDGVLTEVRGVVPEGCATQSKIASITGYSVQTIHYLLKKKSMPSIRGYPIVEGVEKWIEENRMPDGCETIASFARSQSVSDSTVVRWTKLGMPTQNGYVLTSAANGWLASNNEIDRVRSRSTNNPKDGYITKREYSLKYGVSDSLIGIWVKKGMPNKNGHIDPEKSDEWVSNNIDLKQLKVTQRSVHVPKGAITIMGLAKKWGVNKSTILKLIDQGCIEETSGRIWIEFAENWKQKNQSAWIDIVAFDNQKMSKLKSVHGYCTWASFARRHGRSYSGAVKRWVALGLPNDENGIPIDAGDAWMNQNKRFLGWACKTGLVTHIGKKTFGRLLGLRISGGSIRKINNLINDGLPYDPKLGIPIQAGIEWVRDNRPDIVIPPDAWPSSNDNLPDAQAA